MNLFTTILVNVVVPIIIAWINSKATKGPKTIAKLRRLKIALNARDLDDDIPPFPPDATCGGCG